MIEPTVDQIEQALLRHVNETVNGLTLRVKRDPATGENVFWIEVSPERRTPNRMPLILPLYG
jgi:hypothetical protein